jgi:hypothetical protein
MGRALLHRNAPERRSVAAATRQRGLHPVLDVVETFAAPRALHEREGWRDVGVVEAVFSEGFSVREVVYAAP